MVHSTYLFSIIKLFDRKNSSLKNLAASTGLARGSTTVCTTCWGVAMMSVAVDSTESSSMDRHFDTDACKGLGNFNTRSFDDRGDSCLLLAATASTLSGTITFFSEDTPPPLLLPLLLPFADGTSSLSLLSLSPLLLLLLPSLSSPALACTSHCSEEVSLFSAPAATAAAAARTADEEDEALAMAAAPSERVVTLVFTRVSSSV